MTDASRRPSGGSNSPRGGPSWLAFILSLGLVLVAAAAAVFFLRSRPPEPAEAPPGSTPGVADDTVSRVSPPAARRPAPAEKGPAGLEPGPAAPLPGAPEAVPPGPGAAPPPAARPEPAAPQPPPRRVAPPPAGPRPFVLGRTEVENTKGVSKRLGGFEKGKGTQVKRMPEVDGRIEFEVNPPQVKAGDRYSVKVYLVHGGKKPIRIDEITVNTVVDGRRSGGRVSPRAEQVPPRQRVLLDERTGILKRGVRSWALEVVVTSNLQDVYSNRLTWR